MAEKSTKAATPQSATGIGVAALVVGIIAFLSGLAPVWGVLIGVAAIVLGIIALKKAAANKAFAIVGIVGGGIGTIVSIIMTLFWIIAIASVGVGTAALVTASKAAQETLSAQDAISQKQIDAKKDFPKGETARFGTFDVKVNTVNTNYVPADSYSQAEAGSKYVLVNVTVTNPNDESITVGTYDFKLSANGVANTSTYLTLDDSFAGGTLEKGASATGNIAYLVKDDATTFKLQYETSVFTPKTYKLENLTYTLAL